MPVARDAGTDHGRTWPAIDERETSVSRAYADSPKAPTYEELSSTNELLETGIKVIDLSARLPRAVKSVCSVAQVSARPST